MTAHSVGLVMFIGGWLLLSAAVFIIQNREEPERESGPSTKLDHAGARRVMEMLDDNQANLRD